MSDMPLIPRRGHLNLYYTNVLKCSFGGLYFYTFVVSPIAFHILERPQYSILHNKVFPIYLKLQIIAPLFLAATIPFSGSYINYSILSVASISGMANLFWLLPWANSVNEQRKVVAEKFKGDELAKEDAPLWKEFGKVEGLSASFSFLNMVSMMLHGCFLAELMS